MSKDCSFTIHIDNVTTNVSKMVGWVLRTFRSRAKLVMLTCWNSMLQSRLDYCSQLWSPRDQTSINKIEAVQKQFISQIRGHELTGMNYWEKLSILRVYSQERRRECYQICFLWKESQGLVHGWVPC